MYSYEKWNNSNHVWTPDSVVIDFMLHFFSALLEVTDLANIASDSQVLSVKWYYIVHICDSKLHVLFFI